ncbi:MAG: DUF2071 domain-containing protein [Bacteroidota bacterium]|nr:DUF2071 domain-containing protein [Bacteroidota bacterium]
MLSLKNHPFAVETFFESSLVLTYAVPKEELKQFIPECLELDTFNDTWAFVAVAMVQTKDLRPKGFPKFMGNDFFLTGYRIFVRYTDMRGKRLRGLYIIKSETNKNKMSFFGNIFTHYNYTTTDITLSKKENITRIVSKRSGLEVEVNAEKEEVQLPQHSPFADWKEARRFAGPLPFTFTYNKNTKEVLIIEGVRENWTPRAVEVLKHEVGFIKEKNFKGIVLANAFIIENIPYYWKKGKIEKWKG